MSKNVRIGVFIPAGAQLLDTATVDVFDCMSKEYLSQLPFLPRAVVDAAPSVSIFYITTPEQGSEIPLTGGMVIKATHAYTDAEVAPGRLDVVVVPGPNPAATFEPGGLRWLREQFGTPGVDVLSICTGLLVCGEAGIAEGRRASGPRPMQGILRERFPGIKLVGDRQRWVRDGNFWSSGGVTNGNDLLAAYARSGKHWPKEVVELGLEITETGDRGQFYPS